MTVSLGELPSLCCIQFVCVCFPSNLRVFIEGKKLPSLVCLSWLEHHPVHQKVRASTPGQGTYLGFEFKPSQGTWRGTSQCFPLTSMLTAHPLSPSLKSINIFKIKEEINLEIY